MIVISRFSGKCDCYDCLIEIDNYTLEELKNNTCIYVGKNTEPLHIEKMSDLVPYYPYIICSAVYNNGNSVIRLSSESYVDREERERLELYLKEVLRIYNRCKRKKIEFSVEDAVEEMHWGWNTEAITELATRVKKNGRRATVDGIRLKMHEWYRQELVEEMLKHGLNPADYGYERFIKEVAE